VEPRCACVGNKRMCNKKNFPEQIKWRRILGLQKSEVGSIDIVTKFVSFAFMFELTADTKVRS
jgi:hypothetical protein